MVCPCAPKCVSLQPCLDMELMINLLKAVRRRRRILSLTGLVLLIWTGGCKLGTCGGGETVSIRYPVPTFKFLVVGPHVEVRLMQGTHARMEISAPAGMMDFGRWHVDGDTLFLDLARPCWWGVKSRPIEVTLQYNTLHYIRQESEWPIRSAEPLETDTLTVEAGLPGRRGEDDTGPVGLKVYTDYLRLRAGGGANIRLTGYAAGADLTLEDGMARVDARALTVRHATVVHRSAADLDLKPLDSVRGDLYGAGNLILYRHPAVVEVQAHFTGRVIYHD